LKIKDSFGLSINSILHRRLRAWLTLLGIIIGVAAVVSIIGIGDGAQASVNERLSGFGADIITVSPGFSRTSSFGGGAPPSGGGFGGFDIGGGGGQRTATVRSSSSQSSSSSVLTTQDISIIKGISNVLAVNQIVSGRSKVTFGAEQFNASIQGVNPLTWTSTTSVTLASGRLLGSSDTRNIVIGSKLASGTFANPVTLGRRIDVNGISFTVVGILASSGSSFGGSGDSTIYMPYSSAWDVVSDVNKNQFSSIQVKVADKSTISQTVTDITNTLLVSRKTTSKSQNFTVTSSEAIKAQVESVTQTLTLFLGAIAAVSLLVGAVGVANSMFTSVLEKTREIGILKALGATNREVLLLFIIESGLFGFIGGVIGVVIALLFSSSLDLFGISFGLGGKSTGLISIQLMVFAIILSTVIGIVSGAVPARNASKLKPVDALKYE